MGRGRGLGAGVEVGKVGVEVGDICNSVNNKNKEKIRQTQEIEKNYNLIFLR